MAGVNGEQLDLISLESEGRSLNQPPKYICEECFRRKHYRFVKYLLLLSDHQGRCSVCDNFDKLYCEKEVLCKV